MGGKTSEITKMSSHAFSDAEKAPCVLWIANGHGLTVAQRQIRRKYKKRRQITLASVAGMNNKNPGEVVHSRAELDVHRSVMKKKK